MRALTFMIMFMALGFLATPGNSQDPQSDAEIRQKMVGTWIVDAGTTNRTGPYSCSAKGTETYSSNGCYISRCSILDQGKLHYEKMEGIWRVESGILTDTVTNKDTGVPGGPPKYYEHAKVIRVDEDAEKERVTMEVLLPADPMSDDLVPRLLIFEDVYGYQIFEGLVDGCPTILDLSVVEKLGNLGKWSRVRLDTNHGYRELCCTSVRVCSHEPVA